MNPHPLLEKCVNGLLNHSLQAGVLVLLVLFVQFVCKRQLASRWRFALWWIVLLRLALPVNPPSAISLFNLFQPTVGVEGPRYYPPPVTPKIQTAPSATISPETKTAVTENQTAMAPLVPIERPQISSASVAVHTLAAPAIPHHSLDFDDCILPGLAALWAAGALALSGCVVIQLLRFRKKLSGAQVSSDSTLLELLRDCSRELKVSRKIELVETEAVTSPALCGLFKIRLLLPRGLAEKFSARELRHIFLHELAHVQRGDLWLNWLVTALQIVHWFNPLVWLGFARLRADRELACDELALVRAGESEGISYGQTIIKLLEGLGRPATIPTETQSD